MKLVNAYLVLGRQRETTGGFTLTGNFASEEQALKSAERYARAYPSTEYFVATPSVVVRVKPTPVEVEEVRL